MDVNTQCLSENQEGMKKKTSRAQDIRGMLYFII